MKINKFLHNRSITLPIVLLICITILAVTIVYSSHQVKINSYIRTATTHQPEKFTELYFTDYASLPKTITSGKIYNVPFTIVNHESMTFTYKYQIVVTEVGKVSTGKVIVTTVNDDQPIHQTAHIIARQPNDQIELVIRVLNKNLMIHYKAQS